MKRRCPLSRLGNMGHEWELRVEKVVYLDKRLRNIWHEMIL